MRRTPHYTLDGLGLPHVRSYANCKKVFEEMDISYVYYLIDEGLD